MLKCLYDIVKKLLSILIFLFYCIRVFYLCQILCYIITPDKFSLSGVRLHLQSADDISSGFAVVFFVLTLFWSFLGGYKTITEPIYEEKMVENAKIPELDTKKDKSGKYDIVYADRNCNYLYVDKKIFEKSNIEFIETKNDLKIEVYKYIPKITWFTSANILFNQKTIYKIYVPKDYNICIKFKIK